MPHAAAYTQRIDSRSVRRAARKQGSWRASSTQSKIVRCTDLPSRGRLFGEVRKRLGAPDLARILTGAYAPRWFMAAQHVDLTEAVRIFKDVGARQQVVLGTAPRQTVKDLVGRARRSSSRLSVW